MKRITVNVSDETNDKINEWCERLGLSKTQLAGLSIEAGLYQVLRAINPLESLSKEQLAKLVSAFEVAGVDIDKTKVGEYEKTLEK